MQASGPSFFQVEALSELVAHDQQVREEGHRRLCGVDEVGRGPLAGPVVAAAVVLDPENPISGLNDSKKLSAKKRAALEPEIFERALALGVGLCSPQEIDQLNILQATFVAMRRAVEAIEPLPDFLLVDGNKEIRGLALPQRTLVKGDSRSAVIAAASIIAKEHRDRLMAGYAEKYPGYGFDAHAGYPTAAHLEAVRTLGPCPIHRATFKGVKEHLPGATTQGALL